ncbi:glycosyltransferase [bacterium]|nr:glycosyltransferase [bacterium]
MKVSVIIPVRNESPRVDGTMRSLFQQTRRPDEIVVADAASTDDTVERVMSYADRGVPIRVVPNESRFAGGGRNAATKAATHDLLVNMDIGNRADPAWLEEMVRPFEEDPGLEFLGGLYYPEEEGSFTRVVAAVFYTIDCVLPSMTEEQIRQLVPPGFVPGGMCMAYRRSVWEKAGGFCEWSRKGQDRLFGLRVRRIGGKIDFTVKAIVHHHMAKSLRAIIDRHFYYELWAARQGLPVRSRRVTGMYVAVLGVLLVTAALGYVLWPIVVLLVALSVVVRAGKKLIFVRSGRGKRFRMGEWLLAFPVLFALDASVFAGRVVGMSDRLLRSRWRRDTERYLESGVS